MRIIAHLDMDAFYAAIEERENPQFRGLGIVVGADPKNGAGRGVVSTANYQARKYGIHSAMPISTAWRLAEAGKEKGGPQTVFLPVNMDYYEQVSKRIFAIIHKYVPLVEQTSIDEAYLDLSFCYKEKNLLPSSQRWNLLDNARVSSFLAAEIVAYQKAAELIKRIKGEISRKEKLTAKVGIGPNKLIAKMASARSKPDGLTIVRPDEVNHFLEPLPVGDIPGIGPKTEEFLHKRKIFSVAELKKVSGEQLEDWFGKWGREMYRKARGIDESEVSMDRKIKSISEQETFEKDTLESGILIDKLNKLAERVGQRMRNEGILGFRTVSLSVRFADFITFSRSHSLTGSTDDIEVIKRESLKLFMPFMDRRENPRKKAIRLLGVGIEQLKNPNDKDQMSNPPVGEAGQIRRPKNENLKFEF